MMKHAFFKDKRILVTGHTGFVGSWMTLWLSRLGADMAGFSLAPPSKPSHYELLDIEGKITNIKGDIRNAKDIGDAIKGFGPEIIIHMAARTILLESYEDPAVFYNTNATGTLNLLEAERKYGKARAILNVTTDKVYEAGNVAHKESDKLGGFDPYSSSKGCSELITQTYRDSFLSGIGIATARSGNNIGGGEFGNYRLIPDLVSGKEIMVRHPKAIRPWTYVLDVIDGYFTIAQMLYKEPASYSEAWNLASEEVNTVSDLIKEFDKHVKVSYKLTKDRRHEDEFLLLDSSKARERLGWTAKTSFKDTIRLTAEWYAAHKNGSDMNKFSNKLIDIYEK